MKTKTINKILSSKFDNFLASIKDESVKSRVEKNTIITGGSIVSLLLNENVNDYDLYFRNEETALAVAKYYCEQFKAAKEGVGYTIEALSENGRVTIQVAKSKNHSVAGEPPVEREFVVPGREDGTEVNTEADAIEEALTETAKLEARYQPLFLSSNAITLSTKVQLIIRFYGEPSEIHTNYDFVHCTSYWTSWDRVVVVNSAALEAIITKELRYIGSKYPICSVIRTRKFIGRGWTINAGQYVKMAWQISQLDLTNIEVLKDQLVGVDSAYFNQLISALKSEEHKALDANTPYSVDGGFLFDLIDKIF